MQIGVGRLLQLPRAALQLGRLLLAPPCKHLWSKAGMARLREPDLGPADRPLPESELRQLERAEAIAAGANPKWVNQMGDGLTGVVAVRLNW